MLGESLIFSEVWQPNNRDIKKIVLTHTKRSLPHDTVCDVFFFSPGFCIEGEKNAYLLPPVAAQQTGKQSELFVKIGR